MSIDGSGIVIYRASDDDANPVEAIQYGLNELSLSGGWGCLLGVGPIDVLVVVEGSNG
jgi:hypothetical protein